MRQTFVGVTPQAIDDAALIGFMDELKSVKLRNESGAMAAEGIKKLAGILQNHQTWLWEEQVSPFFLCYTLFVAVVVVVVEASSVTRH